MPDSRYNYHATPRDGITKESLHNAQLRCVHKSGDGVNMRELIERFGYFRFASNCESATLLTLIYYADFKIALDIDY